MLWPFAGLFNVMRRFVASSARTASPLRDELLRGQPFSLVASEKDLVAVKILQERLTFSPILTLSCAETQKRLDKYACDVQVRFLPFLEKPDEAIKPIGHWSRWRIYGKHVCDTTQREFLATVWAMLLLQLYFENTHFTIRTDQDSLRWILSSSDASVRLTKWRLSFSKFDVEDVHRAGIKHQAADGLRRLRIDGDEMTDLEDDLHVRNIGNKRVRAQRYFTCSFARIVVLRRNRLRVNQTTIALKREKECPRDMSDETPNDKRHSTRHGGCHRARNERGVFLRGHDTSRNECPWYPRWFQWTSKRNIEDRRLSVESGDSIALTAHFPCRALSTDSRTPKRVTAGRHEAKRTLLAAHVEWTLSDCKQQRKMRA